MSTIFLFPVHFAPPGEETLYAAQFVYVGFHSSPGEGARAVMTGYHEIDPRNTRKTRKKKQKKKN
jgi:hypothetical protein